MAAFCNNTADALQHYGAMAEAVRAEQLVDEVLEAYRADWWRRGRYERNPSGKLPPLSHELAEYARKDVFAHYYRPCGCADLEVSKHLARDTYAAIEAAHAEHRTAAGKMPRAERLRKMLRERDGDICWLCGNELGDDCTIEHRIALANGGTWAFGNLVLAHRECNLALGRLSVAGKDAVRAVLAEKAWS